MDDRLKDVEEKQSRLRQFMAERGFDALVISRRDNFAWITAGGDASVVISDPMAFASLLFTPDGQYLIAGHQDCPRICDEEISGQGYQAVSYAWHDSSSLQEIQRRTGALRLAADSDLAGATDVSGELWRLHYPLTALDIARYRQIGPECDQLLWDIAHEVRPGMTERQIGALCQQRYTAAGYLLDVLLIGVDARIARYRHPSPRDHRLERVALIHPAASKWGLHANITRMLSFGEPPEMTRRAHDTAALIHSAVMQHLKPGASFAQILTMQKDLYARYAPRPDEWTLHYQGGITGYILSNAAMCLDERNVVAQRQAFGYFLTVTGAKVEELAIVDQGAAEVLSRGVWPQKRVQTPYGSYEAPDLLVIADSHS